MPAIPPLLDIQALTIGFGQGTQMTPVVDQVSLQVYPGEVVGIAGESGSGKSVTAFAIGQLLPYPQGKMLGGQVIFDGKDISSLSKKELRSIRGRDIGFIFQEPMTALNPVMRIGRQIKELIEIHETTSHADAQKRAAELLTRVGIPDAKTRLNAYPHELSGGMRQRVMIAMALACRPKLLIADEPTTALDVTIQAEVLDLLQDLQKEFGMALVFISHDLGVLSRMCQRLYIMYAGQIVEAGPTQELLRSPKHPYTQGLINSVPRKDRPKKALLKTIPGQTLAPKDWPQGCRFAARCHFVENRCKAQPIPIELVTAQHLTRCMRWQQIAFI